MIAGNAKSCSLPRCMSLLSMLLLSSSSYLAYLPTIIHRSGAAGGSVAACNSCWLPDPHKCRKCRRKSLHLPGAGAARCAGARGLPRRPGRMWRRRWRGRAHQLARLRAPTQPAPRAGHVLRSRSSAASAPRHLPPPPSMSPALASKASVSADCRHVAYDHT